MHLQKLNFAVGKISLAVKNIFSSLKFLQKPMPL